MVSSLSSVVVVVIGLVSLASGALECRPQGPIFPKPALARSATFQKAAQKLSDILDAAVNQKIRAGWAVNSTSFSIALVSHDQGSRAVPLWEYHNLAANTFLGTKKLDRNSQYQIGSISKAITDAVLVRSGVNMDDPITKYLPALSGPSEIEWDSITLRGLASHLAGIPPNCASLSHC
jgi:CubicO group peptidase (beta-lactamase class C family)